MTDTAERPVLLAVDDDREALGRVAEELRRRYGDDYRVLATESARHALTELEAMRDRGEPVAVVLADQRCGALTGSELLARVRALHPQAKRALLIEWGAWSDEAIADAVLRAMALGDIDYYAIKPWRVPDEQFHRLVSEFIYEWCRANSSQSREIAVVAPRWSPRSHELRSILTRNGVPHAFFEPDSPAAASLLSGAGAAVAAGEAGEPVVVMHDGRVIVAPSNADLARAFGVQTELEDGDEFDLVVVGAGPAGLAAAVYAASEGLRTLVIERESVGGQAGSTSLIRNYLGFSRGISGGDLAQRAYQQAWVFGVEFLMMREAKELRSEGDRHVLVVPQVGELSARAVVLATGVSYRRLGVPSLEALAGAGVFYGASISEARSLAGERVYVVGGGNSAGQAALHLSRWADEVTLVVRGPSLDRGMSQYLRDELAAADVRVRTNSEVVDGAGEARLKRLAIRDNVSGETDWEEASALFVVIGGRPRTDWLPAEIERDAGGYVLTGSDLERGEGPAAGWPPARPPFAFETSVPGIFAVGDVRHDSVKRVASAVGEGSVVIQQVHGMLGERGAARAGRAAAWH